MFPVTGSTQRSIPALVFVMFFLVTVSELVSVMQADSDRIVSAIGFASSICVAGFTTIPVQERTERLFVGAWTSWCAGE